jgi:hypothetical protein
MKNLIAAIGASLLTCLLNSQSASAFALYIQEANQDQDFQMPDRLVAPNSPVKFDLFLDTSGVSDPLTAIGFTIAWSTEELIFANLFQGNVQQDQVAKESGINTQGNNFINFYLSFLAPVQPNQNVLLASANFTTTNFLVNDGVADFQIQLGSATDNNGKNLKPDQIFSEGRTHQVEVQCTCQNSLPNRSFLAVVNLPYFLAQICPTTCKPVPEPVTILGSVAALGIATILKKQHSKRLQKAKSLV